MLTSFTTALSALTAHSTAIDVVGNNLANLNTPGFKANVVAFHDLVSQSLGAGLGETQIGFGVGVPVTLRQFSQGALQNTGGPLDAAIQGDGFFVLKGTSGATQFTRGGSLEVDTAGNLVMPTGERLQGWSLAGNTINTNLPVSDISVPVGSLKSPTPTSAFSIDLNLNAAATAGPPPDTFSTSIQVYDSLGEAHVVTATFTKKAAANAWDYSVSVPDSDFSTPGTPLTGTVTFDGTGKLTSPLPTDPPLKLSLKKLANGAANADLTWNLFNGQTARLTQFAQPSSTSALTQDGSPPANLVRVGIANGGRILAQYSNGSQVVVGQLALASIRNPESLLASGNSTYTPSAITAIPAIGLPDSGGRGSILGGSIESSTVDIAREFTNLIVFQRGYQANARVVTTVDELSQDTINLKR